MPPGSRLAALIAARLATWLPDCLSKNSSRGQATEPPAILDSLTYIPFLKDDEAPDARIAIQVVGVGNQRFVAILPGAREYALAHCST